MHVSLTNIHDEPFKYTQQMSDTYEDTVREGDIRDMVRRIKRHKDDGLPLSAREPRVAHLQLTDTVLSVNDSIRYAAHEMICVLGISYYDPAGYFHLIINCFYINLAKQEYGPYPKYKFENITDPPPSPFDALVLKRPY